MGFFKNECKSEFHRSSFLTFPLLESLLINCNIKGHYHLSISFYSFRVRLTTLLSVVNYVTAPTSSQIFCAGSVLTWEIQMGRCREGSKCSESLGKANQDRNQLLQRAHIALRPQQTSVPGTRGNQC